ncbi:hypothetical protein [Catenuloplanes indicus]|uniref:Uncharacterized protein n=1 Tax=Catenuloplanes indicus TaxID=137267 RepID=A0AAE3VVW7_9ACTN|nr:hypothetical protein [Catenuloplanes indicus]MDQ0364572.1 hypothetical protein [Catenuloplanes indicus]
MAAPSAPVAAYGAPAGAGAYMPPPGTPVFGGPHGPMSPPVAPPGYFVPANPGQPRPNPWRNPWLIIAVVTGLVLNVVAGVAVLFADEKASDGCVAIKEIAESGRPNIRPLHTVSIAADLAASNNDTLAAVGRDYLIAVEMAYGGTDPGSIVLGPVDPEAATWVQGPAAARALIDATHEACGDTWIWVSFEPPQ